VYRYFDADRKTIILTADEFKGNVLAGPSLDVPPVFSSPQLKYV
jgi:hypothetical protein